MARRSSLLYERAVDIARRAHAGQVDKGGAPYIDHPLRVAARFSDPYDRLAAILHDVVEDSPITLEDLQQAGFPSEVVQAVDVLTRRTPESYEEFIERIAKQPTARRVKLADLDDNLDTTRLASPLTDRDLRRVEKYQRARKRLEAAATAQRHRYWETPGGRWYRGSVDSYDIVSKLEVWDGTAWIPSDKIRGDMIVGGAELLTSEDLVRLNVPP